MTIAAATASGTQPVTLVSFDVDGTLIHSIGKEANRLHKESFSYGFKKVFDIDTHIDVVKHHGGTDPLIVVKVLEHHGIPKEEAMSKLPAVEAAMVEYFQLHQERAGTGLELLPGVRQLLEAMQADGGFATCLVTGNLEPIGWGKMKALGIDQLFTSPRFGGFGSDYCSGNTEEMWKDRCEFVKLAAKKAAAQFADGAAARIHVGDTPMDVQAALGAGAVALGVATGVYKKQELEALGSAPQLVVLDDLSNTEAVLQLLKQAACKSPVEAGIAGA